MFENIKTRNKRKLLVGDFGKPIAQISRLLSYGAWFRLPATRNRFCRPTLTRYRYQSKVTLKPRCGEIETFSQRSSAEIEGSAARSKSGNLLRKDRPSVLNAASVASFDLGDVI
jgi:hypothetical protein